MTASLLYMAGEHMRSACHTGQLTGVVDNPSSCCRQQQLEGFLYCGAHLQVAADPGGSSALIPLLQQLA